ncbi:MAG: hypothetical protein K8R99_08200 [Actinomycetia bacterium]|nr:hypothetical protein [Actinomycetes bacterium]
MTMSSRDPRRWLPLTVSGDVDIGSHTVGVKLDVVLLDGDGYVARVPLWDKEPLSGDEARTLADPIVATLEAKLGPGRAVGVDFWHMRSGATTHVSAAEAMRRDRHVVRIIDDYLSDA